MVPMMVEEMASRQLAMTARLENARGLEARVSVTRRRLRSPPAPGTGGPDVAAGMLEEASREDHGVREDDHATRGFEILVAQLPKPQSDEAILQHLAMHVADWPWKLTRSPTRMPFGATMEK